MKKLYAVLEYRNVAGLTSELLEETHTSETEEEALKYVAGQLEYGKKWDCYYIVPKYVKQQNRKGRG